MVRSKCLQSTLFMVHRYLALLLLMLVLSTVKWKEAPLSGRLQFLYETNPVNFTIFIMMLTSWHWYIYFCTQYTTCIACGLFWSFYSYIFCLIISCNTLAYHKWPTIEYICFPPFYGEPSYCRISIKSKRCTWIYFTFIMLSLYSFLDQLC